MVSKTSLQTTLSLGVSYQTFDQKHPVQEQMQGECRTQGQIPVPCSRHIVWNLLKHRKADRVTVLSTHFMDEADILAGEICYLLF